jgi:hypothetical protein
MLANRNASFQEKNESFQDKIYLVPVAAKAALSLSLIYNNTLRGDLSATSAGWYQEECTLC